MTYCHETSFKSWTSRAQSMESVLLPHGIVILEAAVKSSMCRFS